MHSQPGTRVAVATGVKECEKEVEKNELDRYQQRKHSKNWLKYLILKEHENHQELAKLSDGYYNKQCFF